MLTWGVERLSKVVSHCTLTIFTRLAKCMSPCMTESGSTIRTDMCCLAKMLLVPRRQFLRSMASYRSNMPDISAYGTTFTSWEAAADYWFAAREHLVAENSRLQAEK